ncbi:DNA-methyltransferase [Nocardia asiatica]|uniref:DNA-methyltransferase n=1 Tax=Nocardia asiatica TaxID=209252 RepID=UPI00031DF923
MRPYFEDDSVKLYHGDALAVARGLPDGSVDSICTSPPYFGLRDYGEPGQYGLEASPAEYVETMRTLFAELRRVLADDGTLWLNLGDSFYSGKGSPTQPDLKNEARRPPARVLDRPGAGWAKPKSLLGIPWRVAFTLQDDGWVLRNAIVWHKPNAMPESITDRLSVRYEQVFLFVKSRRYWFDLDAIREPHAESTIAAASRARKPYTAPGQRPNAKTRGMAENGANPGDVWSINTQPFPGAHFATMPLELAERCVQAGCKPGGTVLDPFSGSGTTGLAAAKHGRRYVGIDLNREYLDLSLRTRLQQPGLDLGEVS